jgi:hypothetical protein
MVLDHGAFILPPTFMAAVVPHPFVKTKAITHEASAVEEFAADGEAPPDAIIHFQGEDPEVGPLLRIRW